MRHRIIGNLIALGGNSEPELMTNVLTGNEAFDEACKSIFGRISKAYFQTYGGFDYSAKLTKRGFELLCGIEPSYKRDPLIVLIFKKNKESCAIREGFARGYYGKAISSKTVTYANADDKFRNLVDKVHPILCAGCVDAERALAATEPKGDAT